MLSVTIKTIMLNVVILSVVMLDAIMQNVVAPVKMSGQWSKICLLSLPWFDGSGKHIGSILYAATLPKERRQALPCDCPLRLRFSR